MDKYFRVLCKEVTTKDPPYQFVRGKEYTTADYSPGMIDALRKTAFAKGADIVPAIEFYKKSLVESAPQADESSEQE